MNYSIKNVTSSYYASSSGYNVKGTIGPIGPIGLTGPPGSGTETLFNVSFDSPITKKSKTFNFTKKNLRNKKILNNLIRLL